MTLVAISKHMEADIHGIISLTRIKILHDYAEYDGDETMPVGTEVEAYITLPDESIYEPGEAWYINPFTNEDWISFPGDYEVVS